MLRHPKAVEDLVPEAFSCRYAHGRIVLQHALEQLEEAVIVDVRIELAQALHAAILGLRARVRLVQTLMILEHLLLGDEAEVLLVLVAELVEDDSKLIISAHDVDTGICLPHLFARRQRET